MYIMFQRTVFLITVVCLWHNVHCQQYAPRPFKNKILEPEPGKYAFEITWGPVPNWDEEDPIMGYKFLLWEMHSVKKQHLIDGELVDDIDSSPSEYAVRPPEIYVVSANNRRIVIDDVKAEVWYEYAGLAYTKKGEGPISSPVGVKIGGGKMESSTTPSLNNR